MKGTTNIMLKNENIKGLKDEYLELAQSDENNRRKSMWKELARSGRDQFRATPKSDRSWKDGLIPITVDIQNPTWAKIFNFNMQDFYFNSELYLENYFKIMLYRFKNFKDDTFLTMDIPMWGSCALEGSLFNIKYYVFEDKDPWLDLNSVINNRDDLKRAPEIDFMTSGVMPLLIKTYEGICELCGDEFGVLFPEWIRSPFGVAVYVRGYENLLIDMLKDEDFYNDYMRYIVDSRKNWFKGLEKYLGEPVIKANLYNDEISSLMLSPKMYKEKIFPIEQELCDFHGGLHYWHSCGDVSDLTEEIAKLTNIDLFNVGPWTSAYKSGISFKDKAPLEICMNPQSDILEGTGQSMQKRLSDLLKECYSSDVAGMGFKISALNARGNLDEVINKIKLWIDIARQISKNH